MTDLLNMILYIILQKVNQKSILVLQKLPAILGPLTQLYSSVFDTPSLGKIGHFEFLFETLSSLDYENQYCIAISQSISKIVVSLGRSCNFNGDLIDSFHSSKLITKLMETVEKSILEERVQKGALLLTLIMQLLKVLFLQVKTCKAND